MMNLKVFVAIAFSLLFFSCTKPKVAIRSNSVELFSCQSDLFDDQGKPYFLGREEFIIGKKLGDLTLINLGVIEDSFGRKSTLDPFFGRCIELIAMHDKYLYVLSYEYDERSPFTQGLRCRVSRLQRNQLFDDRYFRVGTEGIINDKVFLEKLSIFVRPNHKPRPRL